MAGTSFFTFTAGTPGRSTEVDSNFDWLQRDIVPQLNGSLTNGAYDLGTTTAEWRRLYVQNINPTTTASPLLIGTATAANASSTVMELAGQRALVIPRITTTKRNLLNGDNGMKIYNITDNQFHNYQNGAWAASAWHMHGIVAKVQANVVSQPDYVTALDVTGEGRLLGVGHFSSNASGAAFFTIDGVTTAASFLASATASWRWEFVSGNNTQIFAVTASVAKFNELEVFFTTSLLVRHSSLTAQTLSTHVVYELV